MPWHNALNGKPFNFGDYDSKVGAYSFNLTNLYFFLYDSNFSAAVLLIIKGFTVFMFKK